MRGTIRLMNMSGIPIRLHWTFLAFFPFLALNIASAYEQTLAWGAALYILIFAFVALHEMMHSLVAQSQRLKVREIVLLPIGGVASMERIPEEPRREAAIAAAGPAFNLAVAAGLYLFMWWLPGVTFNPYAIWNNPGPVSQGLVAIFQINLLMALFNLLPAFPTDGGRLLRAFLVAVGSPYAKATRSAALVSKVWLVIFVLLGFKQPMLWLIAAILYAGATAEEQAVRFRSNLRNLKAGHLLPQEPVAVHPETSLGEIVPLLLESSQRHFPVLNRGRLIGMVSHGDLAAALKRAGGDAAPSSAVMRPPHAVSPDDSLADVQQRMEERGLPAACILDNGRLLGIVSRDELRRLAGLLDMEAG